MWEPLSCTSGTNWRRLRFDMEGNHRCSLHTHPPTNNKNNDLILSKKEMVYNRDRHVPLLYFFSFKKKSKFISKQSQQVRECLRGPIDFFLIKSDWRKQIKTFVTSCFGDSRNSLCSVFKKGIQISWISLPGPSGNYFFSWMPNYLRRLYFCAVCQGKNATNVANPYSALLYCKSYHDGWINVGTF